MPQLVRTTNDVIVNALYLLGELGVGETPDGFMLTTGLELINELLDKFSSDSIYIPFLTTINFNFIVGQDTYSVSDIMPANINADRIVDLSFANYQVPGFGIVGNGSTTIPISVTFTADSISNLLTMGATSSFPTGTPITLQTTGTLPSPFISGVTYFVINVSPTTIYLSTTLANATAGIFIDILSNGVGTQIITTNSFIIQQNPTNLVYPLRIINKAQYYNVVRQTNLLSRPGFIFLNKQPQESFVTVYPIPDQPYPCALQVKCMINELTNQDTLGELPPNYYGFLKYALARKFLAYYPSGNWPAVNESEYEDYYNTFKNCNETDLTLRPSVVLTAPEPFYWPNILSY
jgi:hypothetical protein